MDPLSADLIVGLFAVNPRMEYLQMFIHRLQIVRFEHAISPEFSVRRVLCTERKQNAGLMEFVKVLRMEGLWALNEKALCLG
jgi:hypothetical protein